MATEKSAERYELAANRTATPADTSATTVNSEVFESIIIAAGKSYTVSSAMDYTASNTVAVTVQCIVCSTSGTSLGSSGLILQASWFVPNAQSYVVAENKAATAFAYTDAGSALFNVYGGQFRLILQNKGTASIAIQQVTLFRRQ